MPNENVTSFPFTVGITVILRFRGALRCASRRDESHVDTPMPTGARGNSQNARIESGNLAK